MKELYHAQLQCLTTQFCMYTAAGWGLAVLLMGPIVKCATHGWMLRLPATLTFATFLGVQGQSHEKHCRAFHDLMAQPAPHGSYIRRVVKEHFPVWWNNVSAQLHKNGHSLPEMNEYDKSIHIQNAHNRFDTTILWTNTLHSYHKTIHLASIVYHNLFKLSWKINR